MHIKTTSSVALSSLTLVKLPLENALESFNNIREEINEQSDYVGNLQKTWN